MYVENRTKIANFHTPRVFNAPADGGSPWNFVSAQGSQKTRMMGFSDGRKSFPIGLAVLIQYQSVKDTQPATQPPSHVAVAITLHAQASSLKIQPWFARQQQLWRVNIDSWCFSERHCLVGGGGSICAVGSQSPSIMVCFWKIAIFTSFSSFCW